MNTSSTRRGFLKQIAAGTVAAAVPGIGVAQSRELIVANWGGVYGDTAYKTFEGPILEKNGIKIVHDYQDAPQRVTKVAAESRLPRGRIGIMHGSDFLAGQLAPQGALETIDEAKVPNLKFALPEIRTSWFAPWQFSGVEIVYNPKFVKEPPTGFSDLWDPKYAGRVGLQDHVFFHHIQMAGLVADGSVTSDEKAKSALLELRKIVTPRLYPGADPLMAAFKNEEVWIGTAYRASAIRWAEAGVPVARAYPKEGSIAIVLGACVPTKAPDKQAAYDYLNAMLDPAALGRQQDLSFYSAATTNAQSSAEARARIVLTPEQQKAIKVPPVEFMVQNLDLWQQWWNRVYKV